MDLVEIDVFEAHALQAAGDLVHDVAARQADRVRSGADATAHLGGDDDVFARDIEIAQRLADNPLRLAIGIDVGRVDEIDAGLQGALDDGVCGLLVDVADLAPHAR